MTTTKAAPRSYADDIHGLSTRPDASAKLLWLLDDRRSTPGDVSRAISVDPVLTVELIGCANASPRHGGGPITSVARAAGVLGITAIGALVARAAFSLFQPEQSDQDEFWAHSLATAVSSAAVARALQRDPATAYTLGLIHDLGAVLLRRRSGECPPRGPRQETELVLDDAIPEDHAILGARALRVAGVPDELCRAVQYHHAPTSREAPPGAAFIAAGDSLARYLEHGDRRQLTDTFATLGIDESVADAAARTAARDLAAINKYLAAPPLAPGRSPRDPHVDTPRGSVTSRM